MLKITVPAVELYDEANNRFINVKETHLSLEHSLISISKWEGKWHKPFFSKEPKTNEQTVDYIRCMTITQNVDPNVYIAMPPHVLKQIGDYIEDPMTATTFSNDKNARPNRQVITSELIYSWMVANNIPSEYQTWHINRLLTLIRVCTINNTPSKKMSRKDTLSHYSALNKQRRKATGSKG